MRVLRVDMQMFRDAPAPTRNRLSSVNLRRAFDGEDWRAYNRLSLWIKAEVRGFPMLPLQIVMHNDGATQVPDKYYREGIHYVTLDNNKWTQVVWEIEPLARDRVTMLEIGYWVNKMLAAPGDSVAFEIGRIELQQVTPDVHTGWNVGPGKMAFSHSGYLPHSSKTAIASDLSASTFDIVPLPSAGRPPIIMTWPVRTVRSRLGTYQELDFSGITRPGSYIVRAGDRETRPFTIGDDAWHGTIWKTLNFFYGNRCGFDVPGSHPVDHLDWFATHGSDSIVISGGYRLYFASHNLWTDNIVGTADDRTRAARNNPNVNYIAAAAEAIAYSVLKDSEPALAARALALAEDDWNHAIEGRESRETRDTPAFAATRMELAGIGITASLELYRATSNKKYADKAVELARVIAQSQQKTPVGDEFPLAGFFWTGPDRDTLFHQFHRGNDQAPVVALTQLVETLPNHPDWMSWYSTVALYAEYQKRSATTTAPYNVLPAYVYRLGDELREVPDSGAIHGATRAAYRAQVLQGMPMGNDWYLRAFPVWFARRGNYGVLLSQAKALSAASRLRGDSAGLDLASSQAQWIVGRNPFTQSTMYGEGTTGRSSTACRRAISWARCRWGCRAGTRPICPTGRRRTCTYIRKCGSTRAAGGCG